MYMCMYVYMYMYVYVHLEGHVGRREESDRKVVGALHHGPCALHRRVRCALHHGPCALHHGPCALDRVGGGHVAAASSVRARRQSRPISADLGGEAAVGRGAGVNVGGVNVGGGEEGRAFTGGGGVKLGGGEKASTCARKVALLVCEVAGGEEPFALAGKLALPLHLPLPLHPAHALLLLRAKTE